MKFVFPYRVEDQVERSPAAPHQVICRPKIPIRLYGPNGKDALTFALLDTGADECILPHDFVEPLGISLGESTSNVFAANNTRIKLRYGEIQLEIAIDGVAYRWTTVVAFQKGRMYSVMGNIGCLSQFIVRFDGPNKSILIMTPDEAGHPPLGESGLQ